MSMYICENCPYRSVASELVDKDRLAPDELDELARMTVKGIFGNGLERRFRLRKWYGPVQALVNYTYWRM